MTRLSVTDARMKLAEAVNRVAYGGDRIVIERRGRDLVALISVEDLALFERLLEEHEDRLDVEAARRALAEPGERVPYERVRRELGLTE
ncbi:type II toxin-antitoxin system Phd/YefM family antitoxin [Myxococcota bacterium]